MPSGEKKKKKTKKNRRSKTMSGKALLITDPNPTRKKFSIWETKHLSTDADCSTDTTVGWTKNTQKPVYFENRKNHPKCKKIKNI